MISYNAICGPMITQPGLITSQSSCTSTLGLKFDRTPPAKFQGDQLGEVQEEMVAKFEELKLAEANFLSCMVKFMCVVME